MSKHTQSERVQIGQSVRVYGYPGQGVVKSNDIDRHGRIGIKLGGHVLPFCDSSIVEIDGDAVPIQSCPIVPPASDWPHETTLVELGEWSDLPCADIIRGDGRFTVIDGPGPSGTTGQALESLNEAIQALGLVLEDLGGDIDLDPNGYQSKTKQRIALLNAKKYVMAAAPATLAQRDDLLSALKDLMWRFENDDSDLNSPQEVAPDILAARAAIARASGGAE
jgi:hypothetical protein